MNCPGCAAPMRHTVVDAVNGGSVDVADCAVCRAFWFEPYEDLQLTRASTLGLIRMIAGDPNPRGVFPDRSHCPMCDALLHLTHDRQRTTPFSYWRCEAGHGRFTSFIDFLREKNFVKPLSPQELASLRMNVRMIHCSSCGGSIDLVSNTVCPHCGAQVSVLNDATLHQLAEDLVRVPPRPVDNGRGIDSIPQQIVPTQADDEPRNLIEHGLQKFGEWLQRLGEI